MLLKHSLCTLLSCKASKVTRCPDTTFQAWADMLCFLLANAFQKGIAPHLTPLESHWIVIY